MNSELWHIQDLGKNRKASGKDSSKQYKTWRMIQDEYIGAGRICLGTLYSMSLNLQVHYFMAAFTLMRSLAVLQMFLTKPNSWRRGPAYLPLGAQHLIEYLAQGRP